MDGGGPVSERPPIDGRAAQRPQPGGSQPAQELQAGFGADPLGRDRHGLGLDPRLERHGLVEQVDRGLVATAQAGQWRLLQLDDGRDRGAGVLALELAELPLPGEHPQRVAEQHLQTGRQIGGERQRLQARPRDDRRHRRQLGIELGVRQVPDRVGHGLPRTPPGAVASLAACAASKTPLSDTDGTSRV